MRQPAKADARVDVPGTVYLLHFGRPYFRARHYVGWSTNFRRRIEQHRSGSGSPLVRAVVSDGIEIYLARTWENVTRKFERRCHRAKRSPSVCPICRGKKAWPMAPRRVAPTGLGF